MTRAPGRGRRFAGVVVGALALAALGAGLAACGERETPSAAGAPPGTTAPAEPATTPSTTSTTSTSTTSTTAPPTTTTTAPPGPDGPTAPTAPGDSGPQVDALRYRLASLGYFLPDEGGTYGSATRHAVMAFQKVAGLARDGIAGPDTTAALSTASRPVPREAIGRHLEVDLATQVLYVVDEANQATVVNATTGRPGMETRVGTFSIFRQVDGWDHGPLGDLYRPKYFDGGIAVHGGPPVGAVPASHGCVRVPDAAIDWIWDTDQSVPGTTVIVT